MRPSKIDGNLSNLFLLDKNRLENLSCPQVLENKKILDGFSSILNEIKIYLYCAYEIKFLPLDSSRTIFFFKMTKELQKTGYDKTKHVQSCYVLHVKQKASCSTLPLRDHNVIDDDSAFLYDVLKACRLEKKVYSKGILTTYCNYLMLFLKVKVYNLLCGLSFSYCYGAII